MAAIGNEGGQQANEAQPVGPAAAPAPADEAAGTAAAPDVASLLEGFGSRLENFGSQFEERFTALEERLPAGEQEGEEEGGEEEFVPQFGDEDFGDDGELTVEAQTRAVQEIAQRAVADALAPQRAAEAAARRQAYAEAMEERWPELGEEETQDRVFEQAEREARRLAEITGRPELAELWQEPEFLETVYLRGQAEQRAGSEIPAGSEREVTVEGGSVAGPAAGSQGDDGDAIVALANKSKFRL